MARILQTLKASAVTKQKHLSPIVRRRNRLLSTLHLQIEAVKARQSGKQHYAKRLCRIADPETGEKIDTIKESAVRESWWFGEDGHTFLEVRYGLKPLEIAKGNLAVRHLQSIAQTPIGLDTHSPRSRLDPQPINTDLDSVITNSLPVGKHVPKT